MPKFLFYALVMFILAIFIASLPWALDWPFTIKLALGFLGGIIFTMGVAMATDGEGWNQW